MPRPPQTPLKLKDLIKSFKSALKNSFGVHHKPKSFKNLDLQKINFYQEAKRAETIQRDLWRALELYIKAIQKKEKKDSTIKDFASSVHQLGYTNQAVKLMDDCEYYYDGNKQKYFRLRDNLELQIRPTGKHQCKSLLIQNIGLDIKSFQNQQSLKGQLFKSSKRIKQLKFYQSLDFQKSQCSKQKANYILVSFESFSAAKKTLQSFLFEDQFGCNIYWVNSKTLKIVCLAVDGKRDFEDGLIIDDQFIEEQIYYLGQDFWVTFGQKIYENKKTNGFINLLSTHIIKQYLSEIQQDFNNKQNIFESSKITKMDKIKNGALNQNKKNASNLSKKEKFNNQSQQKRKYSSFRNQNY